jgi:hypothetical protein
LPTEVGHSSILPEANGVLFATTESTFRVAKMLIFLHIPKTGGTSITNLLRAVLSPSINVEGPESLRRFLHLSDGDLRALRLAYGHMPYGLHGLSTVNCRYFVFMREPVDRILSSYYYIRRTPEHPLFPKVRNGMTLLDYVRDVTLFSYDDNRQTRQLARYDITDALTSACYWWTAIPAGKVMREHLRQAQESLRMCEFVGLFEEFEQDVLTLFHHLALPKPAEVPRLKETVGRPSVDELGRQVVDEIRDRNVLDIELYEYARALYRARKGKGSLGLRCPVGASGLEGSMTEIARIPLSRIASLGQASVTIHPDAVTLVTAPEQWAYSAEAKFDVPGIESESRILKIGLEVESGVLGVGWLHEDQADWVTRASATGGRGAKELSLLIPAHTRRGKLVFDNWTEGDEPARGVIRSITILENRSQVVTEIQR